jgi:hypothetical protein
MAWQFFGVPIYSAMAWRGVIEHAERFVPEFSGQPQGFLAGSHPGWHGDAGRGLRASRARPTNGGARSGGEADDRPGRGTDHRRRGPADDRRGRGADNCARSRSNSSEATGGASSAGTGAA